MAGAPDVPASDDVNDEVDVGAFVVRREERRRELAHEPVVEALSKVEVVTDDSFELYEPILSEFISASSEFDGFSLKRFARDPFV